MSIINILFILCCMVLLACTLELTKNTNNYGPYTLDFQNYSDCKGPKAKNMTNFTTSLDKDGNGVFNMTVFADTKLDEVKIRVHNVKENKKNFLWSYKLSDPCKHFSIALVIQQNLKAEKCFIKTGVYGNYFNMKEEMLSFLGPAFFYGNYTFRADLLSKKGNIACIACTWVISKK